ncbi:MAG TPA: hypothetical protein VMR52_09800 [Dehalococcoidia bacterium]|nr:hypothetical protein [Dehalococcoidia bacterium]
MRFVLIATLLAIASATVVTLPRDDSEAAWPGDNGRIAYADQISGGIWTMNPDGTDRQQLTTDGDHNSPSWSPDGTRIVFQRFSAVIAVGIGGGPIGPPAVWTMNANGSNQQYIADGSGPSWNEDGTRILFSRDGDIWEMNPDGGNPVEVISDPAHVLWSPVYRPGGDEIAYLEIQSAEAAGFGDSHWEIVVQQPGGLRTQVTDTNFIEGQPDWSPDGSTLVFTSTGHDIYTWDFGALNPPQLLLPGGDRILRSPSYSPDGTEIVFTQADPGGSGAILGTQGGPAENQTIFTVDSDGTNLQEVPGSGDDSFEWAPDWQPLGIATPTPTPSPSPTASPSPTPSPTPTPAGPTPVTRDLVWADNNCSNKADPVDALLTLREDAGLGVNTGDCPPMGTTIEVLSINVAGLGEGDGDPQTWGDADCDEAISPIDALKILRYDAALAYAQEEGCPPIGAEVTIQHAP